MKDIVKIFEETLGFSYSATPNMCEENSSSQEFVVLDKITLNIQLVFRVSDDNVVFNVVGVSSSFFANQVTLRNWLDFIIEVEK